MKVGFTGSSTVITKAQEDTCKYLLVEWGTTEFHHGDCIEADEAIAKIAKKLDIHVVGHPPSNPAKRAHFKSHVNREPLEYLRRNKNIVKDTEVLLATPDSYKERMRSGTWSTIREAERQSKTVYIVYPDGSYDKERDVN